MLKKRGSIRSRIYASILPTPKNNVDPLWMWQCSYWGNDRLPKAAISHRNLMGLVRPGSCFWKDTLVEGEEVVVAFLPFFHIYGQVVIMLFSGPGFTLMLLATPDIDDILSRLDQCGASTFQGAHHANISKTTKRQIGLNRKKLKMIACGADTLHEVHGDRLGTQRPVALSWKDGMTELIVEPRILCRGPRRVRWHSHPNLVAAVIQHDGEDFVPVGEVGELILRTQHHARVNRPEETQASIDIDGRKWLRTGDLVRMDEEGYFHFFDRKRDLIKHKGYAVFARHVEEVLYNHPQIKAAGVVGIPDPRVGAIIKAYVVLQAEARGKVSEEEVIAYCKENLAHYKVPKIVEFRGELPKTDVGKVSRRELREEGEEG
jgi:long-chain acyl-CoA synthetase